MSFSGLPKTEGLFGLLFFIRFLAEQAKNSGAL
jgi:hypothetical protein